MSAGTARKEEFYYGEESGGLYGGKIKGQIVGVLGETFAEMIHLAIGEKNFATIVQKLCVFDLAGKPLELKMRERIRE